MFTPALTASFCVLIYNRNKETLFPRELFRLNELTYIKPLEQRLEHNKLSLNHVFKKYNMAYKRAKDIKFRV
jgi:hypothetical protein